MSQVRLLIVILMALSFGQFAYAESSELSYEDVMDSFGDDFEAVEESVATGRIEAIDIAKRTGIIGGYHYHFGPSTLSLPLVVKLLGRDFGSLELLSVGMDVEVFYFQSPSEHRIGLEINEVEESELH